jgi:hypothetical protein
MDGKAGHRAKPMLLSISRHRPSAQGAPLQSFAVSIQLLPILAARFATLQGRFRTFFHKLLAHSFDGRAADIERYGDALVVPAGTAGGDIG